MSLTSPLTKVLDSIFGADTSKQDREAQRAIQESTQYFKDLQKPVTSSVPEILLKDLGGYSPTSVAAPEKVSYDLNDPVSMLAALAADTSFKGQTTDPRLASEQRATLDALSTLIQGGGLTDADRANLAKIKQGEATAARGQREAVLNDARARGAETAGTTLLSNLLAGQGAVDRQALRDQEVAGQASSRALDALIRRGELAGSMQSEDWKRQSDVSRAQDVINQFNAANIQAANAANSAAANSANLARAQGKLAAGTTNAQLGYNAALNNANALNSAAASNAQTAQNVANVNAGAKAAAVDANNALAQQQYNNELAKASGISGASKLGAEYWSDQSEAEKKKHAAYLEGLAKVFNAGSGGGNA